MYHPWYSSPMADNTTPAARPADATVFLPLVPATGYWVGLANHACADPEYVYVPAFIAEAATADYCGGVDGRIGESLCPACQALDDEIPF